MGIRRDYRSDWVAVETFETDQRARFDRASSLATDFLASDAASLMSTVDQMVERVWAIYYPALALERVPSAVPHTEGTIISSAIVHIVTPRVIFPDKPELPSDSDMVRKYSGVMVAGREQNTSIAFGYAAESYLDFGVPMMFAPVLAFGIAMGVMYAWLARAIWYRELGLALMTVVFWLGLYLFERSWANTLGYVASMLVYLCLPALFLDRVLLVNFFRRQEAESSCMFENMGAAPPPSWH
jgi:hypothetical protein